MDHQASLPSGAAIRRAEGGLTGDMGGEKVILSVTTGKYYNLGRVGGRIWDMLDQPVTMDRLIDMLTAEFEVERTVCEANVRTFLDQLRSEKLIEYERRTAAATK